MLHEDGRLISIEEWPLMITQSSVSERFRKEIERNIRRLDPENLNYVFFCAGFNLEFERWKPIDDQHAMYLRIYYER